METEEGLYKPLTRNFEGSCVPEAIETPENNAAPSARPYGRTVQANRTVIWSFFEETTTTDKHNDKKVFSDPLLSGFTMNRAS